VTPYILHTPSAGWTNLTQSGPLSWRFCALIILKNTQWNIPIFHINFRWNTKTLIPFLFCTITISPPPPQGSNSGPTFSQPPTALYLWNARRFDVYVWLFANCKLFTRTFYWNEIENIQELLLCWVYPPLSLYVAWTYVFMCVYRGMHCCYNHSFTSLCYVYLAFRLSLYYRASCRNQIYGFLLINITKSSQCDVFSSNSYIINLFNNTVGIFE